MLPACLLEMGLWCMHELRRGRGLELGGLATLVPFEKQLNVDGTSFFDRISAGRIHGLVQRDLQASVASSCGSVEIQRANIAGTI
jgi:hypothetical protein